MFQVEYPISFCDIVIYRHNCDEIFHHTAHSYL